MKYGRNRCNFCLILSRDCHVLFENTGYVYTKNDLIDLYTIDVCRSLVQLIAFLIQTLPFAKPQKVNKIRLKYCNKLNFIDVIIMKVKICWRLHDFCCIRLIHFILLISLIRIILLKKCIDTCYFQMIQWVFKLRGNISIIYKTFSIKACDAYLCDIDNNTKFFFRNH